MRFGILRRIAAAAAAIAVLGPAVSRAEDQAAAIEGAKAADRALAAALARSDREAFVALLDPECVFHAGGERAVGPAAVAEAWKPLLTPGGPTLSWEPDAAWAASPDGLVATSGPYRQGGRDRFGRERKGSGRYVTVWRRSGEGRWRVLLDIGTPPAPPPGGVTTKDLAFLSGCWTGTRGTGDGAAVLEERWSEPGRDGLVGAGRTTKAGTLVSFELAHVRDDVDGPVFMASPGGRRETPFALTRLADGEAVFENPSHDFPKRVVYRKTSDGGLVARADGGAGVAAGADEVAMRPCGR